MNQSSFSTLLTLFTLVALVACGGTGVGPKTNSTPSGGNATPRGPKLADKQVFSWPNIGVDDIQTFDPALAQDVNSQWPIDLVFSGLVTLNDKLEVVNDLAARVEKNANGKQYTFTLKDGLKFSDGLPVTSGDIAYSIDRALQPMTKSPVAPTYLYHILNAQKLYDGRDKNVTTIIGTGIRVPNKKTIQINLDQPVAFFLEALSYSTSYVVEKKLVDQFGPKWTDHLSSGSGGTGPFIVKAYDHKQAIFVPNPNWYGEKTKLAEIDMPFIKDESTAYNTYETGQYDFTIVPSAQLVAAKDQPDFHKLIGLQIDYFAVNHVIPPFNKREVRQAFSLALDRDILANRVLKGAVIPSNHIVPEGMPGYFPGLHGLDNDPSKAKHMLQKVYPDLSKFPPVTLTINKDAEDTKKEAEAAVQMWKENLGVTVKLETLALSKELDAINANTLQFWASNWSADYPDPQDWTTFQFCSDCSNNNMNYKNNNVTNLLAKADIEQDPTQRFQEYNTAEQSLVNEVAWMPLDQAQQFYRWRTYVKNFTYTTQALVTTASWSKVYIGQH